MSLYNILQQALQIALLKLDDMREVAKDADKWFKPALTVLALASFVGGLGYMIFPARFGEFVVYRYDLIWVVFKTLANLFQHLIVYYLMGYVAEHIFSSKLDMNAFFRVMAFAAVNQFALIFPQLYWIVVLWTMWIVWTVCRRLGKMEVGPSALMAVVYFLFFALFGANIHHLYL